MKKTLLAISLFMLTNLMILAQNNNQLSSPTIIKTTNGSVEGIIEQTGVRSFKGIPFAAAPVGNLRWKAPQPSKIGKESGMRSSMEEHRCSIIFLATWFLEAKVLMKIVCI